MKYLNRINYSLALFCAFVIAACGGGGSGSGSTIPAAYQGVWNIIYTGSDGGNCQATVTTAGALTGNCSTLIGAGPSITISGTVTGTGSATFTGSNTISFTGSFAGSPSGIWTKTSPVQSGGWNATR